MAHRSHCEAGAPRPPGDRRHQPEDGDAHECYPDTQERKVHGVKKDSKLDTNTNTQINFKMEKKRKKSQKIKINLFMKII